MYGYMNVNDEGMPMMTAAELALEAALDEQSAAERFEEDFYAQDGNEPDWCKRCGEEGHEDYEHDEYVAAAYVGGGEDEWLDGSYEE